MKFPKKIIALVLAVLILSTSSAFALDSSNSGNMSDIEAAFLNFEQVLFARLIKDGYVSAQDAALELDMLRSLFEESEEDVIYSLIMQGGSPFFEPTMASRVAQSDENSPTSVYAALTGRSERDIAKKLRVENLTIWQLAQREGYLEVLQKKMVELRISRLNALIRQKAELR